MVIGYCKKDILEYAVGVVEKNLQNVIAARKDAKKCANDAPGPAVSHSDTSKFQYDILAGNLSSRVSLLEFEFENLKRHCVSEKIIVQMGALIELENRETKQKRYCFVLPGGAGIKVETEKGLVNIISAFSPLFKGMKGLKKDDEFEFKVGKTQEYHISNIL